MQRLKEQELDRKRGSRAGNKYAPTGASGEDTTWGVAGAGDGAIGDAIETVLRAGDGISFYKARTGNAVCVTILSGDERFKFWCASATEFADTLTRVREQAEQFLAQRP